MARTLPLHISDAAQGGKLFRKFSKRVPDSQVAFHSSSCANLPGPLCGQTRGGQPRREHWNANCFFAGSIHGLGVLLFCLFL
jgi:hypothetical protein